MIPDLPIGRLPLVGPSYVSKLKKLRIETLEDLIHHYPYRYQDASQTASIDTLQGGETVTLSGMVLSVTSSYIRSGKTIQKAFFSDGTGMIQLTWFNQPYLVQTLKKKPYLSVSGTVKVFKGKPSLAAPQFEFLTTAEPRTTNNEPRTIHTGRLVPIYSETAGVSSKWLRSRTSTALKNMPPFPEWLPADIVKTYDLMDYNQAIRQIHFPDSYQMADFARARLGFDELFLWQLASQQRKQKRTGSANHFPVKASSKLLETIINKLPYELTGAQHRVLSEILGDLAQPTTMNRLVQGDVGSGKTIVAALAIFATIKSGYKAVFMAPTELLAHQHLKTIKALLEPEGITVVGATKTHKDDLTQADVVVGTHAVLFRTLPENIGLIVIDEQHRFGVEQRSQLLKMPAPPHLLSMTATPIPRTVALTLYAELDVSLIDEMPKNRLPIKTRVVTAANRSKAYQWLKDHLAQGRQIYVVCPLVEASDAEGMAEIKAAESEYQRLKEEVFPGVTIGLVHGQMKSKDKDAVINAFAAQEISILVATSVIEVGIDIPNASIMVIEGAERFGLAQLHQLRGRVGRGAIQSYCLLFSSSDTSHAQQRLSHMETISSGFELANIDLKLRGPGDVFGTKQSGFIDLKVATLDNETMIVNTHAAAAHLIKADPLLAAHPLVKLKLEHLSRSLTIPN